MYILLRRKARIIATSLVIVFVGNILTPVASYGLTGGPSQPEVQSFEPIGTSEMVDLSTGDFVYNIPLLDVEGYPINISYHSGIGMDQEASWVGLGWNINPGVINRNMRSLPDDFKGDEVSKEYNIKTNWTIGLSPGVSTELFGFSMGSVSLNRSLGINYNNYKGIGFESTFSPSISAGDKTKGMLTAGLGVTSNESGIGLTPNIGFTIGDEESRNNDVGYSASASFNSRTGLKTFAYGMSVSHFNSSLNFDFATKTYTPQIQMDMSNTSVTLSGSLGGELTGLNVGVSAKGYYTEQRLVSKEKKLPAYGFIYAEAIGDNENALQDFNREKDMAFTLNTPALAIPNFSYDIYSVAGQGIGGVYKPFRGDIGNIYDPESKNKSNGGSIGVEIGAANLHKIGGDLMYNHSSSWSGKWDVSEYQLNDLGFFSYNGKNYSYQDQSGTGYVNHREYEPYYFKAIGEKTVDHDDYFDRIGGFYPVSVELKPDLESISDRFIRQKENFTIDNTLKTRDANREKRSARNQTISVLTAKEASVPRVALQNKIKSYEENVHISPTITEIDRIDNQNNIRKEHHISEVTAYKEDGSKYVYGIAAYNNEQSEVTFNIPGSSSNNLDGLVEYVPNEDNSTKNKRGVSNYFEKVKTPGYAYAYLLTAVLSPDYIDLTGDGPSKDDYGNYTKINYTRINNAYKWRVPVEENEASYNEGFKTDNTDDKGNYIYGTKEIWYIHSIESKNYVAEFTLGERLDAYGVLGENGGKDVNQNQRRLVKITLYSKTDREINGNNAIPIKTVHFEYDNSLCKELPNSSGAEVGKLTLTKIYFTYGNSNKGKMSPYKFDYSTNNPPYNLKGYDRWGNYKRNSDISRLFNTEFPYVLQDDRAEADENASAWCLTKISLPSGGIIDITYEADDYAYVQDRPAMHLFNVVGVGNSSSPSSINGDMLMTEGDQFSGNAMNNFIYFAVEPSTISTANSNDAIDVLFENYIREIKDKYLYFKFFVSLKKEDGQYNNYEYIPGYAKIKHYGLIDPGSGQTHYQYGWIELEEVKIEDNDLLLDMGVSNPDVNPISKCAWQFTRLNLPRLAYGTSNTYDDNIAESAIMSLSSQWESMEQLFLGFNKALRDDECGKKIDLNKSFIRLYTPSKRKIGGGSRVKLISLKDEWNAMTNGNANSFSYAQHFDYTTIDERTKKIISSGVASYEPIIGNDENPFKEPVFIDEKNLLAPDNKHYMEKPFGESFFPSANVVYSKVKVTNVTPEYNNSSNFRSVRTGYTIHEFYTAKDFPTITDYTSLNIDQPVNSQIFELLNLYIEDHLTASQGYVIELNDMHGKPKAQWNYDEKKPVPISGTEYIYKKQSKNRLENTVKVVERTGEVIEKQIGVDVDFVADTREGNSQIISGGLQGNVDDFIFYGLPVIVPVIIPSFSMEDTRFRSIVTTKVINRYGILDRINVYEDQAMVSTQNVAFDGETGQALITKTTNELRKPIYTTNYPAHWAYEGMGPAYKNIGISFEGVDFNYGSADLNAHSQINPNDYFIPGDELLLEGTNIYKKAWVHSVTTSEIFLIDANGQFIEGTYNLKIIKSGRQNLQNLSIGSITSLGNPIDETLGILEFNDNISDLNDGERILSASSIEYKNTWMAICNSTITNSCDCVENIDISRCFNTYINAFNSIDIASNFSTTLFYELSNYSVPNWSTSMEFGKNNLPDWNTDYYLYYDNHINNGTNEYLLMTIMLHKFNPNNHAENTYEYVNWQLTGNNFDDIVRFDSYSLEIENECPPIGARYDFKVNGYDQYNNVYVFYGRNLDINYPTETCTLQNNNLICGLNHTQIINPFTIGLNNKWVPNKSYAYMTERDQNQNILKDGYFNTFDPFWNLPSSTNKVASTNLQNWTSVQEITKVHPVGKEVEIKDALGRYSAELLGYNSTLVKATGTNTKYTQFANDNFEDYSINNYGTGECRIEEHFDFSKDVNTDKNVSQNESHSGRYSFKVNGTHSVLRDIAACNSDQDEESDKGSYYLKCSDCIGRFEPEPGDYIISAWVKEDDASPTAITHDNANISIGLNSTIAYSAIKASGPIVEGWQRIFYKFNVPPSSNNISINLNSGSGVAYFDDLRIFPANSNMKSYVYDPISLRLIATLDENNYATFYEYDEEGALARIKKETKEGIFTIQEIRSSKKKGN